MTRSTILALSSPPGRSGRAILRLSGPAVSQVLGAFFGFVPPRGAHPSVLRLGDARLPVLVARFVAPASYTGEDLIEVQLPGNPALVERISRLFLSMDSVRSATPGEFTARAFLNHKLTLDQAEGIALTIAAEADADLAAARRLTSGRTGAQYRAWSDELATLLALVEAGIDFTDQEDVVPLAPGALYARTAALRDDICARLGARRAGESRSALPLAALVGAPNAGKSTLFNALLGRRRAVTSPIAGTTRDVLAEPLDLSRDIPGAGPILLADLAGLDNPEPRDRSPWVLPASAIDAESQSRARDSLGRADVLIYCDPTARFPFFVPSGIPTLRVRTKADLARVPSTPPDPAVIPVCALDGRNLAALRRQIALSIRGSTAGADAILAPRHRAALAAATARLADAIVTIAPDSPRLATPELTASLLRESLDALGELTGRISPDDIIGRVFATFCIGK